MLQLVVGVIVDNIEQAENQDQMAITQVGVWSCLLPKLYTDLKLARICREPRPGGHRPGGCLGLPFQLLLEHRKLRAGVKVVQSSWLQDKVGATPSRLWSSTGEGEDGIKGVNGCH
eukprot:scaffold142600_cov19-Tisochrysis_lutea.AAC.1